MIVLISVILYLIGLAIITGCASCNVPGRYHLIILIPIAGPVLLGLYILAHKEDYIWNCDGMVRFSVEEDLIFERILHRTKKECLTQREFNRYKKMPEYQL